MVISTLEKDKDYIVHKKGFPITVKIKESYTGKKLGERYITNEGSTIEVLAQANIDEGVFFICKLNSNFLILVEATLLSSSKNCRVKNRELPRVFGRGFIGYGVYSFSIHKKEYQTWNNMLMRCYLPKYQENYPTYIGCSVDPRWYNFQNFCEDIQYLEGYKEWKTGDKTMNYTLDKDIKIEGNREYSKEACLFATQQANSIKASEHRDSSYLTTGKTYLATFLETGYVEEFYNQRLFARDNNLNSSCIGKCVRGSSNQHKGWIFKEKGSV